MRIAFVIITAILIYTIQVNIHLKYKLLCYEDIIEEDNSTIQLYSYQIEQLKGIVVNISDTNSTEVYNTIKSTKMLVDLNSSEHLTEDDKNDILRYVLEAAEYYNIDPIILYSVLWTESRFQSDLDHKKTYVKALNKNIRAIGLGGVVYEFWGDILKDENIIRNRNDLYDIKNNIYASAFILKYYFDQPKLEKAKTQVESMLMRYYGSQYSNYHNKIYQKVAQILIINTKE